MSRRRALLVVATVVVVATVGWLAWPDGGGGTGEASTVPSSTSSSVTPSSTTTSVAPTTTVTSVVPSTPPVPPSTVPPTTLPTTSPPTTAPSPPTTPPTVPPVNGGDRSVYVLGDSVLLGAQTVPAALAGWIVTYDAEGSRRLPQGIEVLRAHREQIGAVVVIQMGNNYIEGEHGTFASQIDEAMTVLAGVRRVVWLTVAERWPSRVVINQAIRAAPGRWPNAVVADWAVMVAAHPEYAADQLHLTAAGRVAIAQLIASQVGPPPPS